MHRPLIALVIVALAAAGAYAVGARGRVVTTAATSSTSSKSSSGCADEACRPGADAAAATAPAGKLTGRFDSAMSGVCRFACAARQPFAAADVVAQPGAVAGRLTQCPVSGVVFVSDESRPHVRLGADEYVTCCDRCAQKLAKDPRRYVTS